MKSAVSYILLRKQVSWGVESFLELHHLSYFNRDHHFCLLWLIKHNLLRYWSVSNQKTSAQQVRLQIVHSSYVILNQITSQSKVILCLEWPITLLLEVRYRLIHVSLLVKCRLEMEREIFTVEYFSCGRVETQNCTWAWLFIILAVSLKCANVTYCISGWFITFYWLVCNSINRLKWNFKTFLTCINRD